jgi:DHA2 family multidrug resistance protein
VLSFASLSLLPLMMQGVLAYPVLWSGIVSMPRGLAMMAVLQVMGRLDALVDRRLLVGVGLFLMTAAFWSMAHFDLSMSSRQVIDATLLQGVGQGIIFVPLATLAFATMDPALRAEASAISNLLRSLGGSIGISLMQATMAINGQRMHASLAAHVRPDDPVLRAGLPPGLSPYTVHGAVALNDEITRQATMVAFVDDFRLMTLIGVCCIPLVLLLRQAPPRAAARAG